MGRQPRDTSANPAFGSIGLCLEAQVKTSDSLLRVIQILRPWTVWIRYLLSHSWANKEILPKIKPKKLVKLTGHTNVYNSLSNFQYELWSTHNNRKRKSWESLETFVQSHRVNIVFWRVWSNWNHCVLPPWICSKEHFVPFNFSGILRARFLAPIILKHGLISMMNFEGQN